MCPELCVRYFLGDVRKLTFVELTATCSRFQHPVAIVFSKIWRIVLAYIQLLCVICVKRRIIGCLSASSRKVLQILYVCNVLLTLLTFFDSQLPFVSICPLSFFHNFLCYCIILKPLHPPMFFFFSSLAVAFTSVLVWATYLHLFECVYTIFIVNIRN
jgi:hypothetical protein